MYMLTTRYMDMIEICNMPCGKGRRSWGCMTVILNSNLMIPDFPHDIKMRLANRAENLQSQDAIKKNGANLIFIIWGKSGIIKSEFKTILVASQWISTCRTYTAPHAPSVPPALFAPTRVPWDSTNNQLHDARCYLLTMKFKDFL
jgi:hypothetical protein